MSNEFKPVILEPEDGSLSPPTALEVFPYGVTLNRFYISDGKTHDIVIGPYNVQDYKNERRFLNPIVGRYCNRIPSGEQHISKDGIQAVINPIFNESPTVCLHSGPNGLDRFAWTHVEDIATAKLFTPSEIAKLKSETSSSALFTYTSPAGTDFPGTIDFEVVWALTNPSREFDTKTYERNLGSVYLIYRAKVRNEPEGDGKKIVTPLNLTHHWGFNLDASYAAPLGPAPDVKEHKLYIKSENILEGDKVLLPTGKLVATKGTRFDFTGPDSTIGSRYEGGYDHFFMFPPSETRQPSHVLLSGLADGSQNLVSAILESTEPTVKLSSDKSGIHLAFHTNQRGVQFYTGIGLDGTGGRKKIHGGSEDGRGYERDGAAFLEFHAPHAAYLHPFKQSEEEKALLGDDTLLTSDELYNHWVRVDMSHIPNLAEQK
ncbi:galactose mutarotase-like protein [Clavulina sp. PMI_390]|nr:galactose mutarotase-like protein [Clavulina sp. PMI_390]